MKFFLFLCFVFSFSSFGAALPDWALDMKYEQMGSCETKNLSFNAARFGKIPLGIQRDGLDVYLQMIFFFSDEGAFRVRTMEMGLVGCKMTPQGEVCGYKPYSETKILEEGTWSLQNNTLVINGLGRIEKIRDDFPWLGFKFTFNDDYPNPVLRSVESIGGKVQVNFNSFDKNVSQICQ